MGREVLAQAVVGDAKGEVKALLEAQEVILRGNIRRRFPKATLADVRVEGSLLCFSSAGEAFSLDLGPKAAAAWAKALASQPPSLRAKLGLDKGAKALLVGACHDPALLEALESTLAETADEAAMIIALINGPEDLARAQAACGSLPLWSVYPKGKATEFGDTAIRLALRSAGWRDTKSCAVSERLTATRYNRT